MIIGKHTRKAIAATFLTVLLSNLVAPSVSYALTSGPTQPEATSFEPVDTTDMVNLQTGDLTYNIPLIQIPGPEGSYPLSLSYHAGVQPNEDASWVGLGWTLNPGAINRNVNGYPDDWYNPSASSHVFWNGGSVKSYNVGVSIGISNVAGVSAGLSFSQDTYRGFGVGISAGIKEQIGGDNSPLSASLGIGVSPYGEAYVTGGIGFEQGGLSFGVSATNYLDDAMQFGFTGGLGQIGASISTEGGGATITYPGPSSHVSNSKQGDITTETSNFGIDIPTPWDFNISLGYSKQRYYTNSDIGVAIHGSYNTFSWTPASHNIAPDNIAFDEYSLLEDPAYKSFIDYPDPKTVQGGSFPDFDVYSVTAQGLAGNMRPYAYQAEILNQNVRKSSTESYVSYFSPAGTYYPVAFRFDGDFSNSYRQGYQTYSDPASDYIQTTAAPFNVPVYGNNDGTYGFNGALAGSKQVYVGIKVHPSNSLGYPGPRYADGIEGYSITNESGVTYHFGLPAYSYGEENYQEKIGSKAAGQLAFNRETKSTPYAYTWYLTTMTGPDYVDRNCNGIADDADWGFWINFNYGKWADSYVWRNPSEGFRLDEDNQWQNVSMGKREVYYLNAIRTRSHAAIFEKEVRYDAKGESSSIFSKYGTNQDQDYVNTAGVFDNSSTSSLRLAHIYLLNAADDNFVTASSGSLSSTVIDNTDVNAVGRANLTAKALKVIDFNYDYSLCSNTINSFDITNPSVKFGKLTLNSVVTRGKAGINLLPPTQFQYDLGADGITQSGVTLSPGNFITTNGNFKIGDLISTPASPNIYCGMISAKSPTSPYTYTLVNGNYTGATTTTTVFTTKNPSYNKDSYDIWGLYKSDYNISTIANSENLGRQTSAVSSNSVDAWSLRTITTPLGGQVKVNYESDQYSSTLMKNAFPFTSATIDKDAATLNTNNYYIKFQVNMLGYNLADFFKQYGTGQITMAIKYSAPAYPNGYFLEPLKSDYAISLIDLDGTIHATLTTPFLNIATHSPDPFIPPSYIAIVNSNISPTVTTANLYGGGIRVKSVIKTDNTNRLFSTVYNYNTPLVSTLSSGITSYTPTVLDVSAVTIRPGNASDTADFKHYIKVLYSNVNSLYAIARELPPPGVMYEYVTVSNQVANPDEGTLIRNVDGYTTYQFEVIRDNMVGRIDIPGSGPYTTTTGRTEAIITNSGGQKMRTHNLALLKFTDCIGKVKRITTYGGDVFPNGKKLTETVNHYLHDNIINEPLQNFMADYKVLLASYNYQGFIQERYQEIKDLVLQPNPADAGLQATLSTREHFPCIATGQTITNFVNGTQTNIINAEYDFYSGAITKTIQADSYGNNFMTETVPAYRKYESMKPKMEGNSDATKNMLTQSAEVLSWKLDPGFTTTGVISKTGLIAATVNTWSDQASILGPDGTSYVQNSLQLCPTIPTGDVWRKQSTYKWLPVNQTTDGLTAFANFTDFNWPNPSASNANWKNTSNITTYDVFTKVLEAGDVNNNYAAFRMSYGDKKIVLKGTLAKFYEIAYSGAEDAGLTQTANMFVKAADGTTSTAAFHTGTQSLLLGTSGKRGFLYSVPTSSLTIGRNYQASVWVKPTSGSTSTVKLQYDINGVVKSTSISSGSSTKIANGWYLINLPISGADITSGNNTLNVYCINNDASVQAYVDDFRFQPLSAATNAYVYDPFSGELTYILDNSNIYTKYSYDGVGRLISIYKEKLGTGEFKVKDFGYNYGTNSFSSAAITNLGLAKNNCGAGYLGSATSVSVPAGMFTSFISQSDADAQATVYAQDYANTHGTCTQLAAINFTNSNGISGFTAAYTNLSTNGTTTFSIPSGGGFLGNLPVGNYSLIISKSGNSTTYTFGAGCGTATIDGASATFNPISVTVSNCNAPSISIAH